MTGKHPSQRNEQESAQPPAIDLVACAEGLVTTVMGGIAEEVGPHGLSAAEFSLLKACRTRGECTATELVGVLPVDASRISRLVTSLVGKDLVVRRRLPSDRRVVKLSLSDKGKELMSVLNRQIEASHAGILGDIAQEDLRVFESVILRMLANHEAIKASP